MSTTTDDGHTSKMSALSAISSLASSLLGTPIDLQQINQLISCLIQMPSTVSTSDVVNDTNGEDLKLQMRKEKHRQTERYLLLIQFFDNHLTDDL